MRFDRIVEAAAQAGLTDIGLTDHPFHEGLERHHEALDRARSRCRADLRIWIGAELEVVGMGRLILPPNRLPHANYLIAAPSHYDIEHFPPVPHLDDPMEWADRLLTDLENVPGSGAHAIAHPFFVHELMRSAHNGPRFPPLAEVLAEMRPKRLEHLLTVLAEHRIALEISPRIVVRADFELFMESFYRQAYRMGLRFLLGSDSHRPDTIGRLGRAEDFIRRIGLGPDDLWHPDLVRG